MQQFNPLSILLFIPLAWAMCVAGRQLNRLICPRVASDDLTPMERSAFGLLTGAIITSQAVLVIGLLGHLEAKPLAGLFAVLTLLGFDENINQVKDITRSLQDLAKLGWVRILWMGAFTIVALAAVGGCLVPPVSSEWDSLSYHLADPKIYVAAHKIVYIPWESHSNFAFNMEMLFSVGLIFGGIPLAKLFAFKIGAVGVCAVYFIGQRVLRSRNSGILAALIFATLPLAFWESGTGYVDLAATSFAAMALLALAIMISTGEQRYAWLAGLMLGGMLGIKATALVTIGLYAIGIVAHARLNSPGARRAVISAASMVAIALVVGCSWYVKSFVNTGNPVYPFATSIFGGRNWDPNQSAAYAADQHNFGMGHKPSDLLLSPWNLTMFLVPGHIVPDGFPKPFNDYQSEIASLSPLFVIVLVAGLLSKTSPPRRVKLLIEYCLIALVVWFFMTQQVRYLLPIAPALCVVTESILGALWKRSIAGKLAVVVSLAGALGFNLFVDTLLSYNNWNVGLSGGSGIETYLSRGLQSYSLCEYINTHTPSDDKVVTYGEPRTLYLDRDHMWGEPGHSTVIPYGSFDTSDDLRKWLIKNGFHTILINTQYANVDKSQLGWAGMVAALTVNSNKAPLVSNGTTHVYGL